MSRPEDASSASRDAAIRVDEQEVAVAHEEELARELHDHLQNHRADQHAVRGALEPAAAEEGQQQRDDRDAPEVLEQVAELLKVGESNPAKSGSTNSPKPVATISSPLRLSGRRRQAISPHPANAPPIAPTTARSFAAGRPR